MTVEFPVVWCPELTVDGSGEQPGTAIFTPHHQLAQQARKQEDWAGETREGKKSCLVCCLEQSIPGQKENPAITTESSRPTLTSVKLSLIVLGSSPKTTSRWLILSHRYDLKSSHPSGKDGSVIRVHESGVKKLQFCGKLTGASVLQIFAVIWKSIIVSSTQRTEVGIMEVQGQSGFHSKTLFLKGGVWGITPMM